MYVCCFLKITKKEISSTKLNNILVYVGVTVWDWIVFPAYEYMLSGESVGNDSGYHPNR